MRELTYLRAYLRTEQPFESLVEFLARALILQMTSIEQHGLYRRYRAKQEVTSFPRGRILIGDSIKDAWSRGHTRSVAVKYYEFSVDNAHNRLLKYALSLAVQYTRSLGSPAARFISRMSDLENLFGSVPMDVSLGYLPEVIFSLDEQSIPETRDYYVEICRTAVLLVEYSGLLPDVGGKEPTLSFVVDMEKVFEEYCLKVLQEERDALGWISVAHGKDEDHNLFTGPDHDKRRAEPDILIERDDGQQLVVDVKYKNKPKREDINQAVTYAIRFDCSRVVLLCFAEQAHQTGWKFLGIVGDKVVVWVYRMYLDNTDMEAEERRYVNSINEMVHGRVVQPSHGVG